jgi:hypothetical protein
MGLWDELAGIEGRVLGAIAGELVGRPHLAYWEEFKGLQLAPFVHPSWGGVGPLVPVADGWNTSLPAPVPPPGSQPAPVSGALTLQLTGPPPGASAVAINCFVTPVPLDVDVFTVSATFVAPQAASPVDTWACGVMARDDANKVTVNPANPMDNAMIRATLQIRSGTAIRLNTPGAATFVNPATPPGNLAAEYFDRIMTRPSGSPEPEFTLELFVDRPAGICRATLKVPGLSDISREFTHQYTPIEKGGLSAIGCGIALSSAHAGPVSVKVRDFRIYGLRSQRLLRRGESLLATARAGLVSWAFERIPPRPPNRN